MAMVFTAKSRAAELSRRDDLARLETVRVASAADYAQAALLLGEQRAWTEALIGGELAAVQPSARAEYANLADFYRFPDGQLLLARLGEDPVGVVGVRRIDEHRGEGKRLFVRPTARGLGIAHRLMQELFGMARGLGFRSLYIETAPEMMAQQYAWYRRLGFRETAKRGFADMDGVVALEMPLYAT
jgi:GNAT superfamily N-acetyltransferase